MIEELLSKMIRAIEIPDEKTIIIHTVDGESLQLDEGQLSFKGIFDNVINSQVLIAESKFDGEWWLHKIGTIKGRLEIYQRVDDGP